MTEILPLRRFLRVPAVAIARNPPRWAKLVPSANLGDVWVRTLDNLANVGPRWQRCHIRKKSSQPLLFFVL